MRIEVCGRKQNRKRCTEGAQSAEGAYASRLARGSVFRQNGGWAFRVDAGFHAESGKRRQLLRQGFGTKRAAESGALATAWASSRSGQWLTRAESATAKLL